MAESNGMSSCCILLFVIILTFKGSFAPSPYESCPQCQNNGICAYGPGGPVCVCTSNHTGTTCEMECGNCGKGQCIKYQESPMCNCVDGFIRQNCTLTCDDMPCFNSGTCSMHADGMPICGCQSPFSGRYCENDNRSIVACSSGQCSFPLLVTHCSNETMNSGANANVGPRNEFLISALTTGNIRCHCAPYAIGKDCNIFNCVYNDSVCFNGGLCFPNDLSKGTQFCACREGWTGHLCTENINECSKAPCVNGGTCTDTHGSFQCKCPKEWTGTYCEKQQSICIINDCKDKAGNHHCDLECNLEECMYDTMDCSAGVAPWANCNVKWCSTAFRNGSCESDCNNEECLYDGFDCLPNFSTAKALCDNSTAGCMFAHDDTLCNETCSKDCGFDGYDCTPSDKSNNIIGTFVYVFNTSYPALVDSLYHVAAYSISTTINNVVTLKRQNNGVVISNPVLLRPEPNVTYVESYSVYMNIHSKNCIPGPMAACWTNIDHAVAFIAAGIHQKVGDEKTMNSSSIMKIFQVTACKAGMYGAKCDMNCSVGCSNVCDMAYGSCSCKHLYVGLTCNYTCPENCVSTCDEHANLECIGGCTAGYQGKWCNETCPDGYYGTDCATPCRVNCKGRMCNSVNGTCKNGCIAGYQGDMCITDCGNNKYGENCLLDCGSCRLGTSCSAMNGSCPDGCSDGKSGVMCKTDCTQGWYGPDCSMNCSLCKNNTCNAVTGECLVGCLNNKVGAMCNEDPVTAGPQVSTPVDGGLVAGIVILCVLIILAIVFAVIWWRRSQSGKYGMYGKNKPKKTEESNLTNMNTDNQHTDVPGMDQSTTALIETTGSKDTAVAMANAPNQGTSTQENESLVNTERKEPDGSENAAGAKEPIYAKPDKSGKTGGDTAEPAQSADS